MTRQLPVFMALFLVPMLRLSTAHAWKQKLQCLLQLPCQENPGSMTVTAGDVTVSLLPSALVRSSSSLTNRVLPVIHSWLYWLVCICTWQM